MLDPKAKALAQGKNFATLTTILPSGQPSTHIMWVDANDDHVLFNTEIHRQKFLNVQRDPRVTVTVVDADNPYDYVEIRGRVVNTVRGERARSHVDELSQRYMGAPYPLPIETERVILEIEPQRVRTWSVS